MAQAAQRLDNMGEDGWELVTVAAGPTGSDAEWAIFKRPLFRPVGTNEINYEGDEPSVECAYPPCHNRLRKVEGYGPQWCSKEHRSMTDPGRGPDA